MSSLKIMYEKKSIQFFFYPPPIIAIVGLRLFDMKEKKNIKRAKKKVFNVWKNSNNGFFYRLDRTVLTTRKDAWEVKEKKFCM